MWVIFTSLIFVSVISGSLGFITDINATLSTVPEDGRLDFVQLAEKYGHNASEHDIKTEDGYIIKLFSIPGNKSRTVMLVHGVFGTANDYIIRGNTSLAITLANNGYYVWALSVRGSRHSRRHIKLNPDADKAFWDYSVHEFGYYDLPACIDYALNATGQSQLSVVGFSEGTTMNFVLTSTRPEYNSKIKVFVALAPICHLQNTVGPIKTLIQFGNWLNGLLMLVKVEEIAGYKSLSKGVMNFLCTQLPVSYELCMKTTLAPLIGINSGDIEKKFFPITVAHFPAGTSRKNLVHFAQIGSGKQFCQFDYGSSGNYKAYRSNLPPCYDLKKVTMPVVLVSGRNDRISTLEDMELLKTKLVNVISHKILEPVWFNHLDHMWGSSSHIISYPYVLDVLNKYN